MIFTTKYKFFIVMLTFYILQCFQLHAQEEKYTLDDLFEMTIEELMDVNVVTASKFKEEIFDAPGVISVITAKEIEQFGASTLRDILEKSTSITGLTGEVHRNVMAMRGDQITPTGTHVLVMINSRPIRERLQSGTDSDIFAVFPINIIEQIEVIRGPGSVLYGTNAYSGVINIITKKINKNHLNAAVSAGNSNAYITSVTGGVNIGEAGIIGGARYINLADWKHRWYKNTSVFLDHSVQNKGVGLFFNAVYKDISVNTCILDWRTHQLTIPASEAEFRRVFADLSYGHLFSDKWKTTVNLTNTYFSLNSFIKRYSNDFIAEWTHYITPSEKLNIVGGGLINRFQGEEYFLLTDPDLLSVPESFKTWYSAYVQIDYKISGAVKLIGGFQANKIENIDLDIVPRVGMIWNPISDFYAKVLYGQAFRGPSISETSIDDPNWMGNRNLKPEKIKTTDIELLYSINNLRFSSVLFYDRQSDLITGNEVGNNPRSYINYGSFKSQGLELEGKYIPNKNWYFLSSVTYQTNTLNKMKNTTPIPKESAKFGISYTTNNKSLTVGLFDIYSGKPKEIKADTIANPEPEACHFISLNVNLDVKKMFNLEKTFPVVLFGRIENLLNEDIHSPEWVWRRVNSIPTKPGRMYYAGLKIEL